MRQFWTYTLARLGLLAVVAGALWLAQVRGVLLFILAFVISGLISAFLLSRQRDAFAQTVDAPGQTDHRADGRGRPPRTLRPSREQRASTDET